MQDADAKQMSLTLCLSIRPCGRCLFIKLDTTRSKMARVTAQFINSHCHEK